MRCEDVDWIVYASGRGPVVVSCEESNDPSGFIKVRKLIAEQLLAFKESPNPWS
jgi:hypothetical protein